MTLPRSPILVAALAGALLPLGAGDAQAGFASHPDPLVDGQGVSSSIDPVDVDGAGGATVVWNQDGEGESRVVKGRRVAAGGLVGPVLDVSVTAGVSHAPAVASTPSGRSFVAWRQSAAPGENSGVAGRWIEPDGSLGPVLTLAGGGPMLAAVDLSAVVDPAGVATVIWDNGILGGHLHARRVAPDGALGALVDDLSDTAVTNPVAVALPDGSTLAAWRGGGGNQATVLSPDGTPGTPVDVSTVGGGGDVQLAADAQGNALVVWRRAADEDWEVRARRVSPTGVTVGSDIVVDPAAEGFVGPQVSVAADSDGHFIIGWTRQDAAGDSVGYARRVAKDASFAGLAQIVSGGGGQVGNLQTALEDRGSAAVAWSLDTGDASYVSQGRTLDPTGVPFGEVAGLVPGASSVSAASSPSAGLAAFVSNVTAEAGGAISLTRYLAPPVCSDSRVRVLQGNPVHLRLACTGPAIEGAQVAAQPTNGEVEVVGAELRYTPRPGYKGADSFGYAAVNDGGTSNVATVTVDVGKDPVKPRVTRLRVKRRKRRRFILKLRYSEPATARITLERRLRGGRFRRVGRVATRKLSRSNSIKVKGKLRRKLGKGGRFRVTAVAKDAAGNKSKPKRRKFKVRPRRRAS